MRGHHRPHHRRRGRHLRPPGVDHQTGQTSEKRLDALAGEHLHLHNLRSDYLPAHLVGGADAGERVAPVPTRPPSVDTGHRPTDGPGSSPGPGGLHLSVAERPAGAEGGQAAFEASPFTGYLRSDGRKGIRNHLLVVYLVECAHHVAREIATGPHVAAREGTTVQVVGFPGCYPNDYAQRVLTALCTHPNVGGCLLVSLGCESFDRHALSKSVSQSGRWVESLVIQREGGTVRTVARGRDLVEKGLQEIAEVERTPMAASELVVGTICGGSDSTSTLTANPGVGRAFDRLVGAGARCQLLGRLGTDRVLQARDRIREWDGPLTGSSPPGRAAFSRRRGSSSAARSTSGKGRRRRSWALNWLAASQKLLATTKKWAMPVLLRAT